MQKQVLMMVRFENTADISNIDFNDVSDQTKQKGHKFYEHSNNANVLLSEPHDMAEGATYVVTPDGFYRTVFGGLAKRQSIMDIEGLVRNVKSESKKAFKNKVYTVRKLTTKGKSIPSSNVKFACFNIDYDRFNEYKNNKKFFSMLAEYLNGERGDFLGSIDGGLEVEPIRFGTDRKGLSGVILSNQQAGLVRLNNGTYYTCDEIPNLKSKPMILKPTSENSTENWQELEDRGIQLFLDANRYEFKSKQ
jgi:hypothetical protein